MRLKIVSIGLAITTMGVLVLTAAPAASAQPTAGYLCNFTGTNVIVGCVQSKGLYGQLADLYPAGSPYLTNFYWSFGVGGDTGTLEQEGTDHCLGAEGSSDVTMAGCAVGANSDTTWTYESPNAYGYSLLKNNATGTCLEGDEESVDSDPPLELINCNDRYSGEYWELFGAGFSPS